MHRLAYLDASTAHQIGVGLEIVHDLGRQAADVDGVGGGEPHAGKLFFRAGGENFLHAGLGVVKITADGAHLHVAALLGHHLRLLHGGHAPVGVEADDLGAGHVVKALQSCLAGIAGGGGEDEHFVLHAQNVPRLADEQGQQAQRHVLEGAGGAAEQLQHIAPAHGHHRGQLLRFKFPRIAPMHQSVHVRIVRQQRREDAGGHGEGVLLQERLPVHGGDGFGHKQAAVRRNACQHSLGGRRRESAIAGAVIFHTSFSNLFLAFCITI